MNTPDVCWFHVFDGETYRWLDESGKWTRNAANRAEFYSFEDARRAALKAKRATREECAPVVLADLGVV